MKILIIGPLGAGKSSLAYGIFKKYMIERLNLDEVCRIKDGGYRSDEEQKAILDDFLKKNKNWVIEGSQKALYQKLHPDLIVYMRVNRFITMWRFTLRFYKAKKLIGQNISPDLPVQAYHYRKITLSRILEWNRANIEINAQIASFLSDIKTPVICCKCFKDYPKVFEFIDNLKK